MERQVKKNHMTGLAVLLAFTLFAAAVLLVLLTGADTYARLVRRSEESFHSRTAAQYLTTRLQQADREGALSVEDFGGTQALVLRQELEGEVYETRIYCLDGYLRELFAAEDSGLTPEDGEKVVPAAALTFHSRDGMLLAELTHGEGTVQTLRFFPRTGEEGRP